MMMDRALRMAVLLGWALVGLLALLLATGGSLMSEPRIVATLPPVVIGTVSPNQSAGAALFASHCTPCHGTGGQGDGALVRSGKIAAPPDFTQPASMSVQGSQAIYEVITQGRIDKMMPPWEGALGESERRAVAEYIAGLGDETAR